MPLTSRVAILTGAARGIGRACAEAFLDNGAAGVVIADIDLEAGEATARALDPSLRRVLPIRLDVTVRTEHDRVVSETLRRFGRLDILVNNAGIAGRQGTLETHSEEDLDRIIAINLKGVYFGCAAVHAHLVDAGYGRIINIASIAGKEGNPGLVPYSMTKAGVIGLTKAYAKEVAKTGVLVNSLAPAVIETDILSQVTSQVREYMVSKIPMGRTGTPREVAEMVVFLASEKMSFTTGFCFDLSGGRATY
ncbi:MAG TPA: SDR family NAD(P)-dependent oxidoreductase [Planctomycetota bacterium]|nr:SDR family NAD(P)-dependent oxidoreductase [Planctomycetota bacterium]